ncbi:MAG: fused MFS/spermidine synthase [Actinomycetia bacterium]|nr:fused MFS/spermidine synthase [Actinomycetes bacterium]
MMLNFIVFSCGAALMGLELLAARVLAPVMGNSIFVWGAIISSFMIALSIGYWAGGRIADTYGAPRSLGLVIGAAGLSTVLAPLVSRATLVPAAGLGPRLGSLVATTAVFFIPALLLAMVSPLGVRIAAHAGLSRIGRTAGSLYAVSTAGSIAGTLATSFWLIPMLQVEPLVVGIGVALALTSLATLTLSAEQEPTLAPRELGRRWIDAVVALAVAGCVAGTGMFLHVNRPEDVNSFGETVLFRKDTQYHRITVTEKDDIRYLRFDRSTQSAISLRDEYTSAIAYPDYLHLALAANPGATRVLVCGLGGGTVAKRMWRDYPEVSIDCVEIDPVVVDVATRYFGLPDDERLTVTVNDARRFIQSTDELYDIIIVDAYYADAMPYHLTTKEFFGELEAHLRPGGVVAYNVISAVSGDKSELFRSMYRTASEVYSDVLVFPIGIAADKMPEKNRNIVVLATDADIDRRVLLSRIDDRLDGRVTVDGFETFGRDLYTRVIPVADVPVLTDAFAPTDSLIQVD